MYIILYSGKFSNGAKFAAFINRSAIVSNVVKSKDSTTVLNLIVGSLVNQIYRIKNSCTHNTELFLLAHNSTEHVADHMPLA